MLYLLAAVAVVIIVLGTLAHVARHQMIVDLTDPRADVLRRFDIVEEPSLSQWFSSSLHLLASLLCGAIALSVGRDMKYRWLGLSAIFCYASVDEAIMLHEMMDRPSRELLNTSGFLSIAWIIPGAFMATVVGVCYLSFLRNLSRRIATLFVISGVIFLSGAILMEIPGGYLYEKYGFASWHYITSYAIEELLEMLGISLFIFALLRHAERETVQEQCLQLALDPTR